MLCARCKGTYEGYDACPNCAEVIAKREAKDSGNISGIYWLLAATLVLMLLGGCAAALNGF